MNERELAELSKLTNPINLKDTTNYVRALIYGEFGVGKTVLAGMLADPEKKHLIIATDPGWKSLKNHRDKITLDKIDVQEYRGVSQIKALCNAVSEKAPGFENIGTVTIDTISGAVEEYLDFTVDNLKFSGQDTRVQVTNKPGKPVLKEPLEIPGIGDYHLARNKFRPIVNNLCRLPCDVYFLAHVREPNFIKPDDARRATLPQQVNLLLSRQCDIVGFMERDGNKRTVKFETSRRQVAKSRIKELDGKTVGAEEIQTVLNNWRNS